jgi:hypothetical protein
MCESKYNYKNKLLTRMLMEWMKCIVAKNDLRRTSHGKRNLHAPLVVLGVGL